MIYLTLGAIYQDVYNKVSLAVCRIHHSGELYIIEVSIHRASYIQGVPRNMTVGD